MAEAGSCEEHFVVLTSAELGLDTGTLVAVDEKVSVLPREQLALRIVSVLTGLSADAAANGRTVSLSLAGALGSDHPVSKALRADATTVFIEPLQQLVMLRRALTLPAAGTIDISSDDGVNAYVAASRYSTDVCSEGATGLSSAQTEAEASTHIAANLLLRASLVDPPAFTNWIARLRLMLNELPKGNERAAVWAKALRDRIEFAFGLTFEEVAQFAGMMALWSARFTTLDQVFKKDSGLTFSLESSLSHTTLDKERFRRFLERTTLSVNASLSDSTLGGPASILPFRGHSSRSLMAT
jgi:hypothetical protein